MINTLFGLKSLSAQYLNKTKMNQLSSNNEQTQKPKYGFIIQPPLGESVNHDLGIRHQRIPPLSNRIHPTGGPLDLLYNVA